jgi:SAM-dependent methyltransferase
METEEEKLRALRAARRLLLPGGRFVFDVFAPSREDIEETDGRWLEREPGIFERADWDEQARTLRLSVRSDGDAATFGLHWLSAPEWRRLLDEADFDVEALYGWFDLRPYDGEEDMIFVTRRRDRRSNDLDDVAGRDRAAFDDVGRHPAPPVQLHT